MEDKYKSKYCVQNNYTIIEVMENFEKNNERVAIVENADGKVIGVISQGDIIRALTAGMDVYAEARNIVKPSFKYLTERDMEKAYAMFKKYRITMLPVVDSAFKLKGVITQMDIYEYLESGMRK